MFQRKSWYSSCRAVLLIIIFISVGRKDEGSVINLTQIILGWTFQSRHHFKTSALLKVLCPRLHFLLLLPFLVQGHCLLAFSWSVSSMAQLPWMDLLVKPRCWIDTKAQFFYQLLSFTRSLPVPQKLRHISICKLFRNTVTWELRLTLNNDFCLPSPRREERESYLAM